MVMALQDTQMERSMRGSGLIVKLMVKEFLYLNLVFQLKALFWITKLLAVVFLPMWKDKNMKKILIVIWRKDGFFRSLILVGLM